ncbi:MAG: EAL domain-containing protein [Campylobacterota bacterium]|nr:EAL domain-containing protein [Campylobacterota bacterium]
MLSQEDCKNIKLLYVEDDEKTRSSTLRVFQKIFSDIEVAVDGQDGLNKFKEDNSIDIIITDLTMPKMSGIEMIREIKKLNKDIYTIVISANSDQSSFIETIKLGVKGYLIKPMDMTQFIETASNAVEYVNNKRNIKILEQYRDIVDQSAIVSKADPSGKITFVNDKFCEISGYSKEQLLGKNHNIVRDPSVSSSVFKEMWETIKDKRSWSGQVKNRKKSGESYYVDALICPIVDQNNEIIEFIGLRYDITEMINPKRQLLDTIEQTEKPMLVMAKVEGFHRLEHVYSQVMIDNLELKLEQELLTCVPSGLDFKKVFYLGNGEFALVKSLNKGDESLSQQEILLKKFQNNFKEDIIVIEGYEFDLSIIISFSTNNEKLYENTKYGLVEALDKKLDIFFANDLTEKVIQETVKNTETINMIKKAIDHKKVVSYFQPLINNKTMEIEKYESLVRIIDDEDKVVSPFFFLEVAKEAKYYNKITNIVIDNSFEALSKTDKEISINLSAIDIEDLEIRNRLINLVTTNMDKAHRIVFELLEDEVVKDFQIVKDFIALVKAFGVQIAIDDFGAGVSNFERLLDYQPDILKIDACLIKNIETDKYSRDVVETIQAFADKQGIKTVAEFVSNENILEIIKEIGVGYSQGFLLGKPEPLKV